MAFKELDEFFDPTLRLPIRGNVYVVPSPDAKTGLWCQRMLATGAIAATGGDISADEIAALELDDTQEREMYKIVLGTAWDEMLDDGLPWDIIRHAGITAFMWVASGRETAEAYWASGGDSGEARRPTPQDHKAPARTRSARRGSRGSSSQTPEQEQLPAPKTDSPESSDGTGD